MLRTRKSLPLVAPGKSVLFAILEEVPREIVLVLETCKKTRVYNLD